MARYLGSIRVALIAAIVVVSAAPGARGQDLSAIPDSLLDFRYKFTPVFEVKSEAKVFHNELSATFNNTMLAVTGWSVTSKLSVREKQYRLQDRNERNKQFSNSLTKSLRHGILVAVGYDDTRQFSRAALASGGFQDFVLNNKVLMGTVTYTSPAKHPVVLDARSEVSLRDNEFAFKTDKGQGGKINGGARYRFLEDRVRVKVRGAYEEISESSQSIFATFDGLSTTSDSLLTAVDVKVADSLDVSVNWTDYSYERLFADQSRGATGLQNIGAENLFRETERRELRRYGIQMNAKPIRGLTFTMNALHSEQVTDYVNTPTRFSRIVSDEMRGNLNYAMRSGLSVGLKLENTEALRDLGPQSLSSFVDKRRRVGLNLYRSFTPTFNIEVVMSQGITQTFYVRSEENPRDRDQLDSAIRARINSTPFPKIRAALFLSIASTDFVNIDASQSENNRNRLRYEFQPTITYTMSDRLLVEQGYGLEIEFTDFEFDETQNFIDRNVKFWNRVNHKPLRRVTAEFRYELTLHDRGSYLPLEPGGERFLDVEREDRTDRTRTSVRFAINPHLTFVTTHDYSRRRDETVGSNKVRITTDGGIEGGVIGVYKWGAKGDLSCSLKRAERFSPFATAKQEKYWEANLAFKYNI